MPDTNLLKPHDAAAILECTDATLRRWRRNGHGPTFLKIGRKVRYKHDDVLAWIDDQRRLPGATA